MPLLEVNGLAKRFGGFVALESIDLAVNAGERLGLIGPNGSGKSTLVNCLAARCITTVAISPSTAARSTACRHTGAHGWGSPAAFNCRNPSAA
jgi:ABC-type branched-subunit amino acid transport system ATPase component